MTLLLRQIAYPYIQDAVQYETMHKCCRCQIMLRFYSNLAVCICLARNASQ